MDAWVVLVPYTKRPYATTLLAAGVRLTATPRDEAYGRVVVFEDLYGNRGDHTESPPTR